MKKSKKLTDYLKKTGTPSHKEGHREEEKNVVVKEGLTSQLPRPSAESTSSTDILTELLEIASRRFEQQKPLISEEQKESSLNLEEAKLSVLATPMKNELAAISEKLAEEAAKLAEIKIITCDKSGVCSDGRRIGEVYLDEEKGVKWQRGFINTTRLPIFVDFITEEADIKGYVGKALVIESSRGAKAIIPEDYICEIASRYGVLLKLEKCAGYKASPWAEKTKSRKK
ncbi:MAG: hypothetical protein QXE77_04835 [Desulfurococcaceae archaeon]